MNLSPFSLASHRQPSKFMGSLYYVSQARLMLNDSAINIPLMLRLSHKPKIYAVEQLWMIIDPCNIPANLARITKMSLGLQKEQRR